MPHPPIQVTVVIAAHNEGRDIAACISSVEWADEILVVENDSTDDTFARANACGATVFSHPYVSTGAQRNVAIARARHPWILVLDADERADAGLMEAVRDVIAANTHDALRIRRRNYFLGKEIHFGGWQRDHPIRLFRRTMKYDERPAHEHVIPEGRVGTLSSTMTHVPYATLDEYFEKLRRYSGWWAAQNYANGRRARLSDFVVRPALRFVTSYVLFHGWRDGSRGLVLAVLGAMSVAAKYAQLWALYRAKDSNVRISEED